MSLVVDASAVVDYLLRATAVTAAVLLGDADLHAPELIDLELASALRSLLRGGRIGEDRLRLMVGDYLDLPIRLHSHRALLPRIIALRQNFSSYDAAYVALAESLGALFVTTDAALGRAARRHAGIEVLIA